MKWVHRAPKSSSDVCDSIADKIWMQEFVINWRFPLIFFWTRRLNCVRTVREREITASLWCSPPNCRCTKLPIRNDIPRRAVAYLFGGVSWFQLDHLFLNPLRKCFLPARTCALNQTESRKKTSQIISSLSKWIKNETTVIHLQHRKPKLPPNDHSWEE